MTLLEGCAVVGGRGCDKLGVSNITITFFGSVLQSANEMLAVLESQVELDLANQPKTAKIEGYPGWI